MSNTHDEIIKIFREQQQKYAYYVIALCTAAIGFSVHQTINRPLSVSQIPLAISVVSWGLSIYCGLQFLGIQIASLYNNSELIKIQEGRHELTGQHPENIKMAVQAIKKSFENNSNLTMRLAKWQNILFYLGIALFVVWRIWEMSLIKK